MNELIGLIQNLSSDSVPMEAAVFGLCILLALGISKLVFKGALALSSTNINAITNYDTESDKSVLESYVWFGPRFFDGLMFPLLALVLSYVFISIYGLRKSI